MLSTTLRHPLTTSVIVALAALAALLPAACTTKEPESSTFFQRTISPILVTSCVRTNTGVGCHVADAKGNAFGNLDVSTYEGVARRRDLLINYGPYGQPIFLAKNIAPFTVTVQSSFDGQKVDVTADIRHTGGPIFDPTATAYQTLRRWIDNGATENNSGPTPAERSDMGCSSVVPSAAGFDSTKDPTDPDYGTFQARVAPVLKQQCAASNCHGTAANELFLACGDAPEQMRWNYFAATGYLAQTPEQSELSRRPLAPSQGGSFHEGGVVFSSQNDSGYQAISDWAKEHGPPKVGQLDPGFDFFAHKVQPILVKKGCMQFQCHSSAMFHDYRLRGGSAGAFSLSATKRNYTLSVAQMSFESEDPSASRLVRKNLYRPELGGGGIAHRGGPLFEDFGDTVPSLDACAKLNAQTPFDFAGGLDKIPAYCVIAEWLRIERGQRNLAPLSAIVFVRRAIPTGAAGPTRPQDFDVYAPGADLRRAPATVSASGDVTLSADVSLSAGCGLDPTTADVKRPSVSWDGKKIAFAARSSASEPLSVYEMNADGSNCKKHPDINQVTGSQNGLLVHNFDPAYSPADASGAVHLVFASTRGNLGGADVYDYSGPQRTPSDPTKPNANLYVYEPDPKNPGGTRIRQLTFLLNMERYPSFMSDGRVIMSAEKRAPGFYQIALRRQNVDGGDYHPLYAQRGTIGYREATYVAELADKNFAAIFRDPGAPHGGGTLGVFNRSIGIDFTSTDPKDFTIDPSALDVNAPEPQFFLHSLRFPDPAASGHTGKPTTGVYTSPAALPGGKMLVSWGAATDLASFNGDYDLFVMDSVTGAKTKLVGGAGTMEIEAAPVYEKVSKGVFASTIDEPNGHTEIHEGRTEADVTILDTGALGSLLFQNTPTGRLIEPIDGFDLYEDMPPDVAWATYDQAGANTVTDDFGKVIVRRRLIGHVPLMSDSSTHVQIPGGIPFLFKLPDTDISRQKNLPRFQREAFMFYPGEYTHQSFKRVFFNSMCGNCHGSASGRPIDLAVNPDMLTHASDTLARGNAPVPLNVPPAQRGNIEGPPATP